MENKHTKDIKFGNPFVSKSQTRKKHVVHFKLNDAELSLLLEILPQGESLSQRIRKALKIEGQH